MLEGFCLTALNEYFIQQQSSDISTNVGKHKPWWTWLYSLEQQTFSDRIETRVQHEKLSSLESCQHSPQSEEGCTRQDIAAAYDHGSLWYALMSWLTIAYYKVLVGKFFIGAFEYFFSLSILKNKE